MLSIDRFIQRPKKNRPYKLLGHAKVESTIRYLGVEVDDALEIAEQTDVLTSGRLLGAVARPPRNQTHAWPLQRSISAPLICSKSAEFRKEPCMPIAWISRSASFTTEEKLST